jgi:cellulose synthase/poly-beta-1,6-N-acetylglucosamine synthase-like glycosyltransferase
MSLAWRDWAIAVVIPAQDEEYNIERCIDSVRQAAHALSLPVWIVVIADDCTDQTIPRAMRALGQDGQVLECAPRSPGTARRWGCGAALRHFAGHDCTRLWLANTDADAYVPGDWLSQHLTLAMAGAAAVAGVTRLGAVPGYTSELLGFLSTGKVRDDNPEYQVCGANLGVRADAYVDAGGWSHVRVAEDHCLWSQLRRRGWPQIVSDSSVVMRCGRVRQRTREPARLRIA